MKKMLSKEIVNTVLMIIVVYLYIHYVAPYVNRFFNNFFISWGIILIVVGLWGNIAKMVLLQSVFSNDTYKWQNYFLMLLGCLLLVFGLVNYFNLNILAH